MASGHVNRTNRPNTWLHRPSLQREDFPCQLGAVHTWHISDMLGRVARCLLIGGVKLTHRGNAATSESSPPRDALRAMQWERQAHPGRERL